MSLPPHNLIVIEKAVKYFVKNKIEINIKKVIKLKKKENYFSAIRLYCLYL
jgi:hypothetical protein